MTVPAPETDEDAVASAMDEAFFWYVLWRVGLATAIGLFSFVHFVVVNALDLANAAALQVTAEEWIGEHWPVAIALSVILCIVIASWYRIGFWRCVVVFIAGSIIATLICIPMLAVSYAGNYLPDPIWVLGYFATLVLYAIGCGYAAIRRHRRTARRQRIEIEIFD